LTKKDEWVNQLADDYTKAELSPADRAMLNYSVKLTLTPAEVTQQNIQTLRDAGFADRAILDIALIVSYYAYVNRIADGLGVSLEAYWAQGKQDY